MKDLSLGILVSISSVFLGMLLWGVFIQLRVKDAENSIVELSTKQELVTAQETLSDRLDKLELSSFPVGTILPWDPVKRDSSGASTGEYRKRPEGWFFCDGKNGTAELLDRFLLGVRTPQESGRLGGSNDLQASPAHTHTTGAVQEPNLNNPPGRQATPPLTGLAHRHEISLSGEHTHNKGNNRPAYYSLVFLCKVG